jgi:hypothetical protein
MLRAWKQDVNALSNSASVGGTISSDMAPAGLLGLDITRVTGEPCSGQSTAAPPLTALLIFGGSRV